MPTTLDRLRAYARYAVGQDGSSSYSLAFFYRLLLDCPDACADWCPCRAPELLNRNIGHIIDRAKGEWGTHLLGRYPWLLPHPKSITNLHLLQKIVNTPAARSQPLVVPPHFCGLRRYRLLGACTATPLDGGPKLMVQQQCSSCGPFVGWVDPPMSRCTMCAMFPLNISQNASH